MPATRPSPPATVAALTVPRMEDPLVARAIQPIVEAIRALQRLVPLIQISITNIINGTTPISTSTTTGAVFYDTVITPTVITFGPAFDNWNVGTLGQNTLIRYTTDGIPPGSTSRSVRGLVGGAGGHRT